MTADLVNQALNALRQKNFAAARNAIAAYALKNRLEFQHYLIKGLSEMALNDWHAALETFSAATRQFPHQPQLWSNLGLVQENLNQFNESAESFEQSLELKPKQGDVYGNLSNIYRKLGRFEDAETMAHHAMECGAPKAQALNCLGLALGKQGKFDAAEKIFHEALQLEPANAEVLTNLANLAIDRLDFDKAWPFFARASVLDNRPSIRRDEGMARLLAGDYAKGWPLYEARLELPTTLRLCPTCPRYDGEQLAGKKIMLLSEQGFGDTIMFFRYGRLLQDAGARLFWVVREPLKRLLSMNGSSPVFAESDPLPAADYYIPVLSLPLATKKLTPAEAPAPPYLQAPAEPKLPIAKEGRRKIGLVWTGSPTHERDHERSVSLDLFAPLFKSVSAQFYAPFVGAGLDDITTQTPVTPLDKLITDFADTAALLQQLDCLVTVDTATAHLAGALGVKTYLLLQYSPDWRWGITSSYNNKPSSYSGKGNEVTPWYPSLTLLRQPAYGDWDSVIVDLAGRLR